MVKKSNTYVLCFSLVLFAIGTMCLFVFNYYEDFIKPDTMSVMERLLYNKEYHFSLQRNLYMIFYVLGIAILIEHLGFWEIKKIINKKSIKEKIRSILKG